MGSLFITYLLLTSVLLWSVSAMAATYYVAQQAPNSTDTNRGTEAMPWKTLTHACEVAKTGDVVWVKAGLYAETLAPQCDGLTVQAFGDDSVVIVPPPAQPVDPAAWTKVPDTRNVYQCALDPEGKMVRVDGLAIQFHQTVGEDVFHSPGDGSTIVRPLNAPPLDTLERHWTRTADGMLQINMGENPAKHRVELASGRFVGIRLATKDCVVRGIEVRDARTGILCSGGKNVVEYCVVYGAYKGAILGEEGDRNTLHACTFLRNTWGIDCGDLPGFHIMDSNFVIGSGYQPFTNRTPQRDFDRPWGVGTSLRYGNSHMNVFRYNTVTDGTFAGWWPDVNCYSNYLYGNIFTRILDRALYNEYPVNDSAILYNAITKSDTGICSRFSWRMFIMHNYVAGNDVAVSLWGPHVDNPYVFDNLFARNLFTDSNVYINFADNEGLAAGLPFGWNSDRETSANSRFRSFSNIFTENAFKGPARRNFGTMNGEITFSTLESFQQMTGMEEGTKLQPDATMEDQGLGLYTVRIPDSSRPDDPVPMIGNPMLTMAHVDPLPVAAEDTPYFWRQGDAATVCGGEGWQYDMGFTYEWPHFGRPVRRLIRSLPGGDPTAPYQKGDPPRVWLECLGADPSRTPADGSGFWSPNLPTVPGAKITLSWQMSGVDIEPTTENGGPVAFIRFQSLTGQHTEDVVLLGKQADAAIADGKTAGSFDWQKYTAEVTVPATAKRFSVFLGMRPAKGSARFGAIYITTAAGQEPVVPAVGEQEFTKLDLTPYLNHELDADAGAAPGAPDADKVKSSPWALPKIDLSAVRPGEVSGAGVPFALQDRIITLGCFQRPPLVYPMAAMGIPVGRKVSTLSFLHAGPTNMAKLEYWRYMVHYADGKASEVVPVTGYEMLVFKQLYFDAQASLEPAVSIGNVEGIGDVIRWINPRPEVAVKSVDFRSMNLGQSILLAATAGGNE